LPFRSAVPSHLHLLLSPGRLVTAFFFQNSRVVKEQGGLWSLAASFVSVADVG